MCWSLRLCDVVLRILHHLVCHFCCDWVVDGVEHYFRNISQHDMYTLPLHTMYTSSYHLSVLSF